MSRFIFVFGLLFAPVAAIAAPPGIDPCWTLGAGFCDSAAGQSVIDDGIVRTGLLFAGLAGAAAVLFAVIGGAQLLLSFGDESKITKGRNSMIFALGGFALVLASEAIVSFVVASAGAGRLHTASNPFIGGMQLITNTIVVALNILFVLVMVVSGIRMVIGHGKSDEFTKARQALIYAVAGAFFVNVAHALVRGILATGFGG